MRVLGSKARARLLYKYFSKVYDRMNPSIWNEEMHDEALEMLDIQQGDRIPDVGCGISFGAKGLFRCTDDIHGLDQSIHQMQKAWGRFGEYGEVRFYRGDAEWLPFAEDSFNVIWSFGSIEYWLDPATALEEFRRVVRPKSKMLVVGPDNPKSDVFQKLTDTIMLFYDEEETDRMSEAVGLVDIEHHILQRQPGSSWAIVTIARAPEE